TLVIVVVFLPISMGNDLVSNIIKQFCVTVMIATGFSFLASFTIIPWLSSRFGKLQHVSNKNFFGKVILKFEAALSRFTNWISNLLKWCLKSWKTKLTTLGIAVLLLIGSFSLVGAGFVGGEFFPAIDRGEFLIQIELPKDASIEQTNILTQKAEEFLRAKPEVVDLITTEAQTSSGI